MKVLLFLGLGALALALLWAALSVWAVLSLFQAAREMEEA